MTPSANPTPPAGPFPPPHPYPYPHPPVVYVPPPVAPPDPLDFRETEREDRPYRRRRVPTSGGNRGLVIALVVMVAVGLGWFGYVSVRAEWDKSRLPELRVEIWDLWNKMRRAPGSPLSRPDWSTNPAIQEDYRRVKALNAEYLRIQRRHPEWDVQDPPSPW